MNGYVKTTVAARELGIKEGTLNGAILSRVLKGEKKQGKSGVPVYFLELDEFKRLKAVNR